MSGKNTINIRRYRNLCIEIFKTVNNINPSFVKEIFRLRIMNCSNREKYKLNLEIPKSNQVRSGKKGLRYLGQKVWNSSSYHIRSFENLINFKTLTIGCNGTTCTCKICQI